MTNVLSRALPPPNNWQDFESLCFDLFARIWRTNDAEMHGRRGQPQAGVDVYGTDRVEGHFVGVQCKGKEDGYGAHLTAAEIRDEVEKAKSFQPPLEVLVLATTASNDAAAQAEARRLSGEHAKEGIFEVRVQGWQTLRQRIADYPELLKKHFPDFAPVDVVERIDSSISATLQDGEQTRALFTEGTTKILAALADGVGPSDPLKAKIDEANKLLEDGEARAALGAYERLWRENENVALPRNRYRLLANIGNARLHLGDFDQAIEYFKRAHAEDPRWPGARAILATAHLMEGDKPAAFILAMGVLAEDPTSEQAAIVVIDSAPEDQSAADIEELIPSSQRKLLAVLMGLSIRARTAGDLARAQAYARQALEGRDGDWRPMSALGEVLFAPIAAIEGIGFTHRIPAQLQASFDETLQLFRASWAILGGRQDTIRGIHVAANLISALDLAGLEEEAALVLDSALRSAPSYPPILRRYAQRMAEAGDWKAGIRAIDKIAANEREGNDHLFRIQALIRSGQPNAAVAEAETLLQSSEEDRVLELAAAMQLEAAHALGRLAEVLDTQLQRWPRSIILRSVAIGMLPQGDEAAVRLAAEVDGLITAFGDPQERIHAAEALYRAKMFSRAADLYEGLHRTDQDHPALSRHLRALYLADRRTDSRTLFESLSATLQTEPEYAEIGVAIYERSGLLGDARRLLEARLASSEDLRTRLHWLQVIVRLDDEAAARAWLEGVPAEQQGTPGDLMTLALAMDHHLGDLRSLPIAYRALRIGYGDPQIQLGYIVGLFLTGRVGRGEIPTPASVSDDTAVVIENHATKKRLIRIIETEPDPRIERDEIAPTHPLSIKLHGLAVGAEVELDAIGPEPATFTVVEIHNKFVFAHFRTLQAFPTMFPESPAFGSFEIDESKGDDRFKPLFDSAKSRHERIDKITEAYRSGLVPLASLAKMSGSSAIEIWESFRATEDIEFQVAVGTAEEFAEADSALAAKRIAIIDPITLYALAQIGVVDQVKAAFVDIGIVQTSLDFLQQHLFEQRNKKGTQQGSFGWDGEHYRLFELTDAMIDEMVSRAQAAVDFGQTLTLLPAEGSEGIRSEARDVFEGMDSAFLDTVLAAQGEGRVLLCDDRAMRLLAKESATISAVWTQACCKHAVEAGEISPDKYFELNGRLAEAGYFFTMIGHEDFLRELGVSDWTINGRIELFIKLLARPTNDLGSITSVMSQLMLRGFGQADNKALYKEFFNRVFTEFRRAQPDNSAVAIAKEALENVVRLLRARAKALLLRRNLLQTTSATPVQTIATTAANASRDMAQEITQLIAGALEDATPAT